MDAEERESYPDWTRIEQAPQSNYVYFATTYANSRRSIRIKFVLKLNSWYSRPTEAKTSFQWAAEQLRMINVKAIPNPNYAIVSQWYATFLSDMGRHQEAVAEIERAIQLDPLSVNVNTAAARLFYFARQFDRAEMQARSALVDPN